MNIHELATYNLDDAVKFHQRLNPVLWARDEHLLPEVRNKLLKIAADFQEFLGVEDLKVKDITVSGSNAAYSYTKQSDIDLHLVVEMPNDPVYQELFAAKKYQYNTEHDITIGGADVELYVQPDDQPHHSQGIYSIKNSDWVKVPQRKRSQIDDTCVLAKVDDLATRIKSAIASQDRSVMDLLWKKIKIMRQSGLENHGEFGCENVAFKLLRNNGSIGALKSAITAAQDRELSLPPKKRVRYGFSEDVTSTPDGVSASTNMFLNETPVSNVVQSFVQDVVQRLGIENMPEVVLHDDPDWSKQNNSFGQYNPDTRTLHVSLVDRHLLDILRTVAHELTHCRQNELDTLPDHAGETGSRWENQANAQAGILMRDFADANPEYFTESYTQAKSLQSSMKTFRAKVRIKDRYGSPAIEAQVVARNHDMARQLLRAQYGPDSVVSTVTELKENASGYIPKNKKEAAQPQYAMALSVDIKPGQVGKEANKLGLKTGRNGEPGLLSPSAQNLLREFAEFTEEQDNLFEITMSPSSLKKLSAQTGALAGMEFEMIVPGIGDDDGDQEPDYDFDQRCRSIQDARDFFYDGDYNGRQDIERMSDRMQNDYAEWLYERIDRDFVNESEYLISEWIANNVDESEWNPNELEGEARQEVLDEFISNVDADPSSDYYQQVLDEYREENQDSYDESDWLDAEDLDLMSGVENVYNITWPHWRSTGGGEVSIEDTANSFQAAIGRDVKASGSYHSGRVARPSTKSLHYIVEPDASLDPDDSDDQGLEFVSPPLPIEELLSDLNKVKAWADKTGCYTNDSTGLHINVSVPGWTQGTDQLDYVKLALLLGDEFVLDSFGRAGNTYTKSAMGKIVDIVRQRPDRAQLLMNRMKQGLDQLATRLVHSRQTEKYTSINVKDGYIEFRSPGGDWLNDKFPEIENTLRRFTVALSAAVDPAAYREEYLKKLYKLLNVSGEKDPLSYFAKYAAGELPKAALKSFIRQAQLERGVKRGKETGPMVWKVYKEGKGAVNGAIIELVATTEDEAKQKAAREWGEPLLVNVLAKMDAEPLRPYKQEPTASQPQTGEQDYIVNFELDDGQTGSEMVLQAANANAAMAYVRDNLEDEGHGVVNIEAQAVPAPSPAASTTASHPEGRGRPNNPTGRYGIVARSDQAAYGRTGGPPPAYQFRFDMANLADQGHGRYVLAAWAARNNVDAADYIVVDTTQYADAAQGGIIDVEPAQQPAGMAQWNGQWKVLVDGEEVYRFGGVGNSQADANRIAAAWLRDNGQGVSGEGFEVYPVMSESLTETDQLTLRDFNVKLSPHYRDQAHAKGVDLRRVDDVLFNLSKVKDKIMSLEPGRAFILHNGQGTGMGMRRHQGNRLTLATVYPTKAGFTKGQHPTFRVEVDSNTKDVDEDISRRGFVRGVGAAAGLAATGVGAKQLRDYEPQQISHITQIVDAPDAFAAETQQLLYDKYVYNRLTKDAFLKMRALPDYDSVVELEQVFSNPMNSKVTLMFNHNDGRGYWLTPKVFDTIRKEMAADQLLAKNKRPGGVPMAKDPLATDRLPNSMRQSAPPTPGAEQDRAYRGIGANQPTESLEEDWRTALATGAMAGAMAMDAQAKAPEMVHQTVEPGDTVYSIARQNNVNPLEIYRLNKMDRSTKLEVGQRVVVPDYSKPVSKMPATVAPTVKPPPAQVSQPVPSLKDKISSMLPKFPDDDEGVVLLSDNPDAEAALQTAAKAAGLKGSELAQFMAQTRHESWDFGKMKEVGNQKTFAKYEKPRLAKQLGNKVQGDGERFKGRGFIQLTGRDNYTRASQQIFGDDRLVKNPDLATRLDVGAQIALWFWKNQVRPVVKDFNNTTQVVKAINADEPAKVVQQRHTKFKEYLAVL